MTYHNVNRVTDSVEGGGLYVAGGGILDVYETVIKDHITYSNIHRNDNRGSAIANVGGTVRLRNVLIADNGVGGAIWSSGASATTLVENVTVADNADIGLWQEGGSFAVTNSIVWGHLEDLAGFPTDGAGALPDVWYSNIGDGQNVGLQGCHSIDPLFADLTYYHLQSTESHYENGYFSDGSWTTAAANSPLIDQGDPASDASREPTGTRINIGAYGNTEVAAHTPTVTASQPAIANPSAAAVGHRSARLRGNVTDIGEETPMAWFTYWLTGSGDTNTVPVGLQDGTFGKPIDGLQQGATYQYRVHAENRADSVESAVATFTLRSANADLYVSANGDHTTGDAWENAYQDWETAIAIAEPGDRILMAGGQTFEYGRYSRRYPSLPDEFPYNSAFLLHNVTNLQVIGGFEAQAGQTPGESDPDQWETVLRRSSGNARVLIMLGVSNCVLRAVTLTNGDTGNEGRAFHNRGAGLLVEESQDVILDRCRIVDNTGGRTWSDVWSATTRSRGGGIAVKHASAILMTNCWVAGNTVNIYRGTGRGAGLYVGDGGDLTIRNSFFMGGVTYTRQNRNTDRVRGGAVNVFTGGFLDLRDTVIADHITWSANSTHAEAIECRGSAVAVEGGTAWLRNLLILNNGVGSTQDEGGAIWTGGATGHAIVENCTIIGNGKIGLLYGNGIFAVTNTIVWNHTVADLDEFPIDGEGYLRDVSHALFALPDLMDGIRGCTTDDPLFVDHDLDKLRDKVFR